MKRSLAIWMVGISLLGGCRPGGDEAPPSTRTVAALLRASVTSRVAAQGGYVTSFDERGYPSFLWATAAVGGPAADTPTAAARQYLLRFAEAYGLSPRDVEAAEVKAVHHRPELGVIVQLRQRVDGVEVYPGEVRLLMRPTLELVAISGSLPPAGRTDRAESFRLSAGHALTVTLKDRTGVGVSTESLLRRPQPNSDFVRFELADDVVDIEMPDARAKRIYLAEGSRLRPAYFVELYAGRRGDGDTGAFRYIVSAQDGRVLDRRDLTQRESFEYRVYADVDGNHRPWVGPHDDFQPHPTGLPDGSKPAFVPNPPLISMEGFNTNPAGQADPWLEAGATETRGNNADAYADDDDPDGFSAGDLRATVTSSRTFDHLYDATIDPAADPEQIMASVTQLFYVVNWMHDSWYDSGFDEAAGNAQQDNFGRGGADGDALRAEAQDGHALGQRNNANMSTPSDGMAPRMQMYAWRGEETRSLTVTSSTSPLATNFARFGPRDFDVTAAVVLVDDGSGDSTDGCQAPTNVIGGQIAMVRRGNCTFAEKAANAQTAGAVGMILANNRGGGPPRMGGSEVIPTTIALLSITEQAGDDLVAALQNGPVTATMMRSVAADRDGSFAVGVVAHEWGHYMHHRLTDCGEDQCRGISEGWGDFISLSTQLREGDDLDGVYARSIWARLAQDNGAYFGGRRVPYSVDPAANALRFRHITDGEPLPSHPIDPSSNPNSEVHNTGEVWASMMFEAYIGLLRPTESSTSGLTFAEARRRMADYVVAGMMLTPRDSTFTEARDGILAAAAARSPTDLAILAAAFARRGAGTCAVAPPRDTSDNSPVVESFGVQPQISVASVAFSDDLRSCDGDGVLDAEERGRLVVRVDNGGPETMAVPRITVESPTPGIGFPDGRSVSPPPIGPYGTMDVEIPMALDASVTGTAALELLVRVEDPNACETTVTSTVVARVNFDERTDATRDDVEAETSAWTPDGSTGAVWSRIGISPLEHTWRGVDHPDISDTWLASPTLQVSSADPLVVRFEHRYRFEAVEPDGSGTNWDGGVIEIRGDDGIWRDVADYDDPGYRGALTGGSNNPLAFRDALVGTSPGWPDREVLTLDFGTAFAGEEVSLRYRIGTDAAVGDYGWEIDNLVFTGIDNAPFTRLAPDGTVCPPEVVAEAGPGQVVDPGVEVTLDGSGSTSEQGLPLTFVWTQSAGPEVSLTAGGGPEATFTAPARPEASTLSFLLTVDNGARTATDSVDITVAATEAPVADAGSDRSVAAGVEVTLDGSSSTGGSELTYAWTQVDAASAPVELTAGGGPTATFTAPEMDAEAMLTFELSVSDGVRSDRDTVVITVEARPPLWADAGEDQTVEAKETVTLVGSGSTGPAGLTAAWSQTAGPPVELSEPERLTTSFIAPSAQEEVTLEFELTVFDGARDATDAVRVTVRPGPEVGDQEGGCGCTASTRSRRHLGGTVLSVALLFALGLLRRSGRTKRS